MSLHEPSSLELQAELTVLERQKAEMLEKSDMQAGRELAHFAAELAGERLRLEELFNGWINHTKTRLSETLAAESAQHPDLESHEEPSPFVAEEIEDFPIANSLEKFYQLLHDDPTNIPGYTQYGHHSAVMVDFLDQKIVDGDENEVSLSKKFLGLCGESYISRYIVIRINEGLQNEGAAA